MIQPVRRNQKKDSGNGKRIDQQGSGDKSPDAVIYKVENEIREEIIENIDVILHFSRNSAGQHGNDDRDHVEQHGKQNIDHRHNNRRNVTDKTGQCHNNRNKGQIGKSQLELTEDQGETVRFPFRKILRQEDGNFGTDKEDHADDKNPDIFSEHICGA